MFWRKAVPATFGSAILFLGMFLTPVLGSQATSWTTYHDPGLDLTLSYPTTWALFPRAVAPQAVGQLITLTEPETGEPGCSVAIGQDPHAIDETSSLLDWSRRRLEDEEEAWAHRGSAPFARTAGPRPAGFSERVQVDGDSVQTVFLRHGRLVWFVQAQAGTDAGTCRDTVERIVSSLRLGPASPDGLSHTAAVPEEHDAEANSSEKRPRLPEKVESTWYTPVTNNSNGKPWDILCGSPLHTQGASYAADVQVPYGTEVRAAKAGTVETVGDSAQGFGKYIVIESNGYYHYYAHLSSIKSYIVKGYQVKLHGLLLGYSGNSGLGRPGTQGSHLHFHVQDGLSYSAAKGVSLVGMAGFTANSKYPAGSGTCGSMGR